MTVETSPSTCRAPQSNAQCGRQAHRYTHPFNPAYRARATCGSVTLLRVNGPAFGIPCLRAYLHYCHKPSNRERRLADDVANPVILHNVGYGCWQPHVKGYVLQQNTIYNHWRLEDLWLDR